MQLLISDANILIDLEVCGLTAGFLSLPFEIGVPDFIFFEELQDQHPLLLKYGLKILDGDSDTISDTLKLSSRYKKPKRNDIYALSMAKHRNGVLLTGDMDLRNAAEQEGIVVHGTIWIIEELVKRNMITIGIAKQAYHVLEQSRRRLPFGDAHRRLEALVHR